MNWHLLTDPLAAGSVAHHNWWRIFWLCFAALGLTVEAVALHRNAKGDTASETIWWLRGPASLWSWRTFAVAAVMLWLTVHFVFGWFQ